MSRDVIRHAIAPLLLLLVWVRIRQNLGCSHRLRACVRQIGMASYSLEYGIIFIRI